MNKRMSERRERILQFLRRQITDVRSGGVAAIVRKACMVGEVVLAVPLVLAARLLRPWVKIRFGGLPTDTFGPLAATVEIYICERELGLHGRGVDIFCVSLPVCNQQLTRMWTRTLRVTRFARSLERVNRWLPGGEGNRMPWGTLAARDRHDVLIRTSPHLSFTPTEEAQGREWLQGIGVQPDTPFVCFQARDQAYARDRYSDEVHRDQEYRNADLQTYLPAMQTLTRSYTVFRMGASVEQPLIDKTSRVIDYATQHRTDFLDMFLLAHCRFYLGDTSGIYTVPMIFRRPIAFVNFIPMEYVASWGPRDLFIPKKIWSRQERRLLTFSEMLSSKAGPLMRTTLYERAGLEVVDNTPDEITALAIEMDQRLLGTWQTTPEDEELQRRFWTLFRNSPHHGVIRARIGAEFLRQHRALLESPGRIQESGDGAILAGSRGERSS